MHVEQADGVLFGEGGAAQVELGEQGGHDHERRARVDPERQPDVVVAGVHMFCPLLSARPFGGWCANNEKVKGPGSTFILCGSGCQPAMSGVVALGPGSSGEVATPLVAPSVP